ncbi:MAG: bifunctional precorrin-2 dehydrogenase/sirohydrochlorin ferrochelatase [Prevotellaceae bacterium]|jgi:siroheme synthase-like protein|nr:bifunctional precorrin-2 dehydrogenase/sirohydrochlorin ferrochelatase [Prevotellaceae bacterium]
MKREDMIFLPIAINITGKKILIIGGGRVGYHKAAILSRFTDKATVISPVFHEGFASLPFVLVKKAYSKDDLDGAFLVYACTESDSLNAQIKSDAAEKGILAGVCDNPMLCDFVSPAIFKAGNVSIAVTSNAQDVRRSIDIRNQLKNLVEKQQLIIE